MTCDKRFVQLFITVISIYCFILTCTVFASTNWNVESGNWSNDANWTNDKPTNDLAENDTFNISKSTTSICTLNTDEGLFNLRWVMRNGQILNIENDGRFGAKWSRVGQGSASYVNMTGNGTYVLNDDDLYCGLEGGSMEWKMYDTSSLITQADDGDDGEEVHFGYNNGYGLLQLNGSGVTVDVDRIHFSNRADLGDPSSTLEFVLDAGGASTIVTKRTYIAENGSSDLLIIATDSLAADDIVLIESTSGYGIGGNGVFDTLNGGPATEGTLISLGGNMYSLTYTYDAGGDSSNNDIALIYESDFYIYKAYSPSPANGADVLDSPATLSWINPDPQDGTNSITCTVYFGTDSDRENMDSVTLAPDVSTVEINTTNFPIYGAQPLADETDYYWIVDCVDASPGVDPAGGEGDPWTFHTYLSLSEYDGFGGQATGGTTGSEVTVYNAADLKYWAYTSTVPCVITIGESFTMSGGNGTSGGACPIRSSKTIQGANPGVVFTGNFEMSSTTSNVIIRNLTITNPDDPADPDGASIGGSDCITIYGANNVLITHCTITDAADGLLDIRNAADNITISWCKFYYTWNNGHNLASLGAGASDTDSGLYRITWHHNWWSDLVNQRMPMIRFGSAHMYNNYFNAPGNYYCTSSRVDAEILSQHNYYQDVNNPLYIESGSDGKVCVEDNIYDNSPSPNMPLAPGTDTVFMPPYYYAMDPVEEVPAIITACAGNRLYGDLNDDNAVDADDLSAFAELWLNDNSSVALYQDLDGDGLVSLYEFMQFAANWFLDY